MSKKILLLSGPNLSVLGLREPSIYGKNTLNDYINKVKEKALDLGMEADSFQSDSEGDLVTTVLNAKDKYNGIIINAGALTHYSYSLLDALSYFKGPIIELHISNPLGREPHRHKSVIASRVNGTIAGFGLYGYELSVIAISNLLESND